MKAMRDNAFSSASGRYSVEVSGKLYELTVKKTNPVVSFKKRKQSSIFPEIMTIIDMGID